MPWLLVALLLAPQERIGNHEFLKDWKSPLEGVGQGSSLTFKDEHGTFTWAVLGGEEGVSLSNGG